MSRSDSVERILLIEDDDHIREVAELALTNTGDFEVATCATGRDAHPMALDFEPDLVLLDVMMPELDGPAVLDQLREHEATTSVPVVFLTARAQPEELEEYRALGVADVIVKPFDPVELPDRIREAWSRANDDATAGR